MLLERLETLKSHLLSSSSIAEQLEVLGSFGIDAIPKALSPESELLLKKLSAIGQGEGLQGASSERLAQLVEHLSKIDRFYRELGGIVGYQIEILRRLNSSSVSESLNATFHSPHFDDISEETKEVKQAVQDGLEALAFTAEFYPLGGAADRLHLVDEETGHDLPAAKMVFAGRTLLEGLIRDLEGREYLYEKRYGKRIEVPIGIMTSPEKENHRLVMEICKTHNWFGRSPDRFRFFCQPLVPAVNEKGNWIWLGPGKPLLKPGGHGAIWKLARDGGVFEWLKGLGVSQIVVRQINNPLAGVDYGLLAFLGLGAKQKMTFGFVSCPRLLKAAEGVNVLIERNQGAADARVERVLTNIEYCDFAKYGIADAPLKEGEPYSRFTCNTNILFANLEELDRAVARCPFPGLLINLKKARFTLESGEKKEAAMARLESTMQNIADIFTEEHDSFSAAKTERTFVTYNHRHKTISTVKKAYLPGGPLQETPEHCFYDLLQASRELLEKHCGFILPPKRLIEEVQQKGPECAFLYHPILGPLYSVIAQKIRGGKIGEGSELQLEMGELDLEQLELNGSLRILAEKPKEGRCILKNVRVDNRGVDWSRSAPFWKCNWARLESMVIHLKGRSEFIAMGTEFLGNREWVVEEGTRTIVKADGTVTVEIF